MLDATLELDVLRRKLASTHSAMSIGPKGSKGWWVVIRRKPIFISDKYGTDQVFLPASPKTVSKRSGDFPEVRANESATARARATLDRLKARVAAMRIAKTTRITRKKKLWEKKAKVRRPDLRDHLIHQKLAALEAKAAGERRQRWLKKVKVAGAKSASDATARINRRNRNVAINQLQAARQKASIIGPARQVAIDREKAAKLARKKLAKHRARVKERAPRVLKARKKAAWRTANPGWTKGTQYSKAPIFQGFSSEGKWVMPWDKEYPKSGALVKSRLIKPNQITSAVKQLLGRKYVGLGLASGAILTAAIFGIAKSTRSPSVAALQKELVKVRKPTARGPNGESGWWLTMRGRSVFIPATKEQGKVKVLI